MFPHPYNRTTTPHAKGEPHDMEDLISQLLLHVRGIWKYRWHGLGVSWSLAVLGWGAVASMPDDYQSTARVYVDTQTILKPLLANMTSVPNAEQQVSIMSRTLLSRPNLERVMRMVDLDVHATSALLQEQQLERLLGGIRITGTRQNDIYTISYSDRDPTLVRDVVQALLTIFVEGSVKSRHGDSQQAVKFIDEQIKRYEQRLVAAENALKQFKLRNSDLLPRQGVDYSAQVAIATDALNAARLALMETEQSRLALRAQIAGDAVLDGPLLPVRVINPDIDARISAVNKSLDSLRLQYTDQHPDVIAAQRLLSQLEARKREESARQFRDSDPGHHYSPMLQQLKVALADTEAKLAAARVRVEQHGQRVDQLRQLRQAVPEIEAQLAQLNRDYEINKDNYEKLISRREAAKLSGELSSTPEMMAFRIIDPPTLPVAPVGPNRPLLTSLVLAAALAGGAGAAWLTGQVRPAFSGPGAMRALTGLQVLGTVSMNWTVAEQRRQRRGHLLPGAALAMLLLAYAGVLAF